METQTDTDGGLLQVTCLHREPKVTWHLLRDQPRTPPTSTPRAELAKQRRLEKLPVKLGLKQETLSYMQG